MRACLLGWRFPHDVERYELPFERQVVLTVFERQVGKRLEQKGWLV